MQKRKCRAGEGAAPLAYAVFCIAAIGFDVRAEAPTLSTVGTVAGGSQGQADGVGTLASFNSPHDLVVRLDGTILVSDKNNGIENHLDHSFLCLVAIGNDRPGNNRSHPRDRHSKGREYTHATRGTVVVP